MLKRALELMKDYPERLVLIVVLLSFLVRVALILWRQTHLQDYSRTDIGAIPYGLLDGQGYSFRGMPSSYFGPGYTYLWTWAMSLFGRAGGQLGVQLLQALMLSLTAWPVYYFSRAAFGSVAALFGAAWMAFYPELLVLSSTMYSDSLVLFLWCVILGLFSRLNAKQRPSFLLAALLGTLMGWLALTKGRMLVFSAVLLVVLPVSTLWRGWQGKRRLVRPLLAYVVVCVFVLLTVSPWTVRNFLVHGSFVPLESTIGYNLWLGNNPAANGTGNWQLSNMTVAGSEFGESGGQADFPIPSELQEQLERCRSETACDDLYRSSAISFIKENPPKALALGVNKAAYAWWFSPTSAAAAHILYRVPWVVTLVFFALGALHRLFVARRVDWLMWAILLVSTLLQMLFFVVPRLRYPVYPIVFVFAGYGAWLLARAVLARYADPRPAPIGS